MKFFGERDNQNYLWLLFITYILFLNLLYRFRRHKIIQIFLVILAAPLVILIAAFEIIRPLWIAFISSFFVLALCWHVFYYLLPYLFNIELTTSSVEYLTLTFTAIIVTNYGNEVVKYYIKINDIKENSLNGKIEEQVPITLDQAKIRYFLFIIYFLLLIISNVSIQPNHYFFGKDPSDIAIVQSFVTYIAFDRIISNKSLITKINQTNFQNK